MIVMNVVDVPEHQQLTQRALAGQEVPGEGCEIDRLTGKPLSSSRGRDGRGRGYMVRSIYSVPIPRLICQIVTNSSLFFLAAG